MKKKRVTTEELSVMKTIVVVFIPDSRRDATSSWCVGEFEVDLQRHRLFELNSVIVCSSLEEADIKSSVMFPGKIMHMISTPWLADHQNIDTLLRKDYTPPCGYDVFRAEVEVFEVEP